MIDGCVQRWNGEGQRRPSHSRLHRSRARLFQKRASADAATAEGAGRHSLVQSQRQSRAKLVRCRHHTTPHYSLSPLPIVSSAHSHHSLTRFICMSHSRHDMPGYTGYKPTSLLNDRGPRNPTSTSSLCALPPPNRPDSFVASGKIGRAPPKPGSHTGLIIASMKSS
jgi:hypothetical protein